MVRIEKMVALYSQSIDRPPFLSFFLFLLFSSFFFLPLSRDRVRTVYFSRAPIGISAVPNDSAPSSDAHFRRCTRNYGGAISNGRRGACDTQLTTGFRNWRGRLIWKSGRFANRSFQWRDRVSFTSSLDRFDERRFIERFEDRGRTKRFCFEGSNYYTREFMIANERERERKRRVPSLFR